MCFPTLENSHDSIDWMGNFGDGSQVPELPGCRPMTLFGLFGNFVRWSSLIKKPTSLVRIASCNRGVASQFFLPIHFKYLKFQLHSCRSVYQSQSLPAFCIVDVVFVFFSNLSETKFIQGYSSRIHFKYKKVLLPAIPEMVSQWFSQVLVDYCHDFLEMDELATTGGSNQVTTVTT